jgi:signal peptidase II
MSQGVADNPAGKAAASKANQRAGRCAISIAIFSVLTLVVFAADQALKHLAFKHVAGRPIELHPDDPERTIIPHHEMPVVEGLLSLRLTANTGAVFGLGDGMQWLFITVSIIAAVVIARLFWVSPANAYLTHVALALILAGDLGNLYDRIAFWAVRDMLWLFPGTGLWPWIFNLADAALMLGVGLILVVTWRNETRPRNEQSGQG